MNSPFADHFSRVAPHYAGFRPTYPAALFSWLAKTAPGRALAWDCGAGSGQASLGLAGEFERVVATDASRTQIDSAPPHPRVAYRVASAESSGLSAGSADLVAVAQALHWFDLERFYAEVRRVAKPGGLLAVWTYGILAVDDARLDARLLAFYRDTVGPYWPPERLHVESGYRTLPFPFAELEPPPFAMEADWSLAQLLGYLRSWSATGRFLAEKGLDPVAPLEAQLTRRWGGPNRKRRIAWPLSLRVGRM